MVIDFESRTNQKLEFAKISLEEIKSRPEPGLIDYFQRSHEENFLFHLVGAKDSFLQEINVAYGLGVDIEKVDECKLLEKLKRQKRESTELNEIIELKYNKSEWFAIAIGLRNKGSHRFHLTRLYRETDNENKGKIYLLDPFTDKNMDDDCITFLTRCLNEMKALLQQLRKTFPNVDIS